MITINISDRIANLINLYGNSITVQDDEKEISGKAFITPLRYKNKMYLETIKSSIGTVETGHFLYIGIPNIRIDQKKQSIICSNGGKYIVKMAEVVRFYDDILYVWAILQPYIEEV